MDPQFQAAGGASGIAAEAGRSEDSALKGLAGQALEALGDGVAARV